MAAILFWPQFDNCRWPGALKIQHVNPAVTGVPEIIQENTFKIINTKLIKTKHKSITLKLVKFKRPSSENMVTTYVQYL